MEETELASYKVKVQDNVEKKHFRSSESAPKQASLPAVSCRCQYRATARIHNRLVSHVVSWWMCWHDLLDIGNSNGCHEIPNADGWHGTAEI
ncbi:hypothetical protein scyTo_0009729 [Scyliorhinus torazame]|uniref:Uncharacterized protein n=1 Tax=Scyliorhinus torazame TaxID=75743 RepID=A0A401NSI6_SCYTO|nr:hypothetical protein [Scyliorhinus torazame]